jgi:D-alanyl-D-alanine carboxypeptidase/D-alanyl-D-alanine-endopeptidase (penicillin-binding protein 4)
MPASNTKLVVTAAASALLPPDFTVTTRVYGGGPLDDGVLDGALIVYGGGDPTFSDRCYAVDTLALGACDWLWSRMGALADAIVARGVRSVRGALVADGSYFESRAIHPGWEAYDLTWWYAAPVTALGYNDNSLNVTARPGPARDAPPVITFAPALGNVLFENRAVTSDSGTRTTLDFFRDDARRLIWAEGTVPLHRAPFRQFVALPDPNRYFAEALRQALADRGVSIAGPTETTSDPYEHAACRVACTPLVSLRSRPLAEWIFPILNTSQNWFAEMLLKQLGAVVRGAGSWEDGLAVERRFLIDSVGIDSLAFDLTDGSGLATGNLIAPRALARLLSWMWRHPRRAAFLAGMPRSGQRGSLRTRFVGTPLAGRVVAKTGSINHVNTLSGYIERERGGPLVFSVMLNLRTGTNAQALARIDSVVVELGR